MGIKNDKLKVLKFKVASPCNENWSKMKGEGGVRFCGSCKQHVYDSSLMTLAEVEALVNSPSGACMKLYQRKDGTILTKDCSLGFRKKRRKQKVVGLSLAALAGIGGLGFGVLAETGDVKEKTRSGELMGEVRIDASVFSKKNGNDEVEELDIEDEHIQELMGDIQVMPEGHEVLGCLLYTSPSPRDATLSRMPSSA